MPYTINYEPKPSHDDTQVLGDGIMHYAKIKKNQPPIDFFAFFIRDEKNKIYGGCNGAIYYGCFYIDLLWVDEKLRGKGWGSQLINLSEKLAMEKKSLFMTVNTMDWEALDFYKRFHFYVEYERQGYANNSTLYFLRKDLL